MFRNYNSLAVSCEKSIIVSLTPSRIKNIVVSPAPSRIAVKLTCCIAFVSVQGLFVYVNLLQSPYNFY